MFPPEILDLRYYLSDSGAALDLGGLSVSMAFAAGVVQQLMETATYVVQ
jgi:hypothetical protein